MKTTKSKIQMKTLRIIIAALFMAISSAVAQQTISISELVNTKWRVENNWISDYKEYTLTEIIWKRKDGSFFKYPYYLTDTPVTSHDKSAFDYSKVGKTKKGSYMVSINERGGIVCCASIESFDKKKGVLVIKVVTQGVTGAGGIDRFKLVK